MIPVGSWLTAQIIKIIINLIVNKKFDITRLFGDGGMPSGHSATVMSLTALVGWGYGFNSPLFAIAGILAIIVMNDASGVRFEAGKHAVSIKQIAEIMNGMVTSKDQTIRTEKLKELVGHTPLQVLCGALLGIFTAALGIFLIGISYQSLAM
jgi:acid phosphatase family membrane protein YuiD